jgi:hypothetical protein
LGTALGTIDAPEIIATTSTAEAAAFNDPTGKPSCSRSGNCLDEVQGCADDAVGINVVIVVDVVDGPGLAEAADAERGDRHVVDRGEVRQRLGGRPGE